MKKIIITLSSALFLLLASNHMALAATNTYKVKNGDTLSKIAKAYHVSVSNLKTWNHLTSDIIHPNKTLKLSNVNKQSTVQKPPTKFVKQITVSSTAYNMNCKKCKGITATGLNLKKNPNLKVISVDPKIIKLGTKVYVEGYGYAIAGDTGGNMKGNKIDVFIPSLKDDLKWGHKTVKVYILN